MTILFIASLIVVGLLCGWIYNLRKTIERGQTQESKLSADVIAANTRYDELVQSIKLKAAQPKEKPPMRRQARTFSEFRDADERGVKPRGMKERPNGNNL